MALTRVGYDDRSGTIVVGGNGVFPARTLSAVSDESGSVDIRSIAGRSEQYSLWSQLADLDGNAFGSMAEALRYLDSEFSKSVALSDTLGAMVTVQENVPWGFPVAVDRVTSRLRAAWADNYGLSFVVGMLSEAVVAGDQTSSRKGMFSSDDWTQQTGSRSLSPGSPYFLAKSGGMTLSAPDKSYLTSVKVGVAVTASTLAVDPSLPILL